MTRVTDLGRYRTQCGTVRGWSASNREGANRVLFGVYVGDWPKMEIDVEKVSEVAVGFEQSSEAIGVVASGVAKLAFDSSKAGRNYSDVGVRIVAAYDGVESSFRRWQDASKATVVALRGSLAGYRTTDGATAEALSGQSSER